MFILNYRPYRATMVKTLKPEHWKALEEGTLESIIDTDTMMIATFLKDEWDKFEEDTNQYGLLPMPDEN